MNVLMVPVGIVGYKLYTDVYSVDFDNNDAVIQWPGGYEIIECGDRSELLITENEETLAKMIMALEETKEKLRRENQRTGGVKRGRFKKVLRI